MLPEIDSKIQFGDTCRHYAVLFILTIQAYAYHHVRSLKMLTQSNFDQNKIFNDYLSFHSIIFITEWYVIKTNPENKSSALYQILFCNVPSVLYPNISCLNVRNIECTYHYI